MTTQLVSGESTKPELQQFRHNFDRAFGSDYGLHETKRDMRPKFRVLFLCTRNDDRSIFAEYFLRSMGGDRFEVYSGGESPSGEIQPPVLKILRDVFKIDPTGASSKSWHTFTDIHFDFVITVCDDAREMSPVFPGKPVTAHWSFADPTRFEGSDQDKHNELVQTAFRVKRRVELFNSLPMEKLDHLQREAGTRQDYEG